MTDTDSFCAFIADIKKSKQMNDLYRFNVQKHIEERIAHYNQKYKEEIAASIDFSGGDQFQALFYHPQGAYRFACNFRDELFPISFRIGLGLGNWSLRLPGESTNKQDGTSYHNARKAYDKAHKLNMDMIFCSENEIDAIINVLIHQENIIYNEQTEKQKEISLKHRTLYPLEPKIVKDNEVFSVLFDKGSHKAISDELNTTRQNILQQIKRSKLYEQRELQSAVLLMMKYFDKYTE